MQKATGGVSAPGASRVATTLSKTRLCRAANRENANLSEHS